MVVRMGAHTVSRRNFLPSGRTREVGHGRVSQRRFPIKYKHSVITETNRWAYRSDVLVQPLLELKEC